MKTQVKMIQKRLALKISNQTRVKFLIAKLRSQSKPTLRNDQPPRQIVPRIDSKTTNTSHSTPSMTFLRKQPYLTVSILCELR